MRLQELGEKGESADEGCVGEAHQDTCSLLQHLDLGQTHQDGRE